MEGLDIEAIIVEVGERPGSDALYARVLTMAREMAERFSVQTVCVQWLEHITSSVGIITIMIEVDPTGEAAVAVRIVSLQQVIRADVAVTKVETVHYADGTSAVVGKGVPQVILTASVEEWSPSLYDPIYDAANVVARNWRDFYDGDSID